MATWHYTPSGEREARHRYLCDKCIPRGCDCQKHEKTGLPLLDKKGRELPCIEYWQYPNGYHLTMPVPPHFRGRPKGTRRKWIDGPQRFDRRRWRSELRQWLKRPVTDWWTTAKKVRNDLVATRLLKLIHPIVIAMKLED